MICGQKLKGNSAVIFCAFSSIFSVSFLRNFDEPWLLFQLPSVQSPLLQKSTFLGQTSFSNFNHKFSFPVPRSSVHVSPTAKFNLFEILGGRGICNGEGGLQEELKKSVSQDPSSTTNQNQENSEVPTVESVPEDGFEKELMGLTGGFPGDEKGLQKFIEQNPPPKNSQAYASAGFDQSLVKKPKPPELPMLLPGMIVIVKNPKNPFCMYCGIVQRITDGKAGVLYEGGNNIAAKRKAQLRFAD